MKTLVFVLVCCSLLCVVLGNGIDVPGSSTTRAKRAARAAMQNEDLLASLAANYSGTSYDWTVADLTGCSLNDVFNVSFVVFDHVWLKFEPIKPPASSSCKTFIFDSQIYVNNANATVSVGILQPLPQTVLTNQNLSDAFSHSFFLGNVTGEDLLDAIEVFDGEYGGGYDFITANCAIKVIDVMHFFGLDVYDRALLSWINMELQTPSMIQMLRNASNLGSLYPTLTRDQILAKNNTEIFGTLIDFSIKKALDNYASDLAFYKAQKAPLATPVASPSSLVSAPTKTAPTANGKVSSGSSLVSSSIVSLILLAIVASL